MGFRFRRSVRIIPGVRLNISKSGLSTSIGGHGATLNVSKKGTRATVGLPGTGLSYRTGYFGKPDDMATGQAPSGVDVTGRIIRIAFIIFALIVIGGIALTMLGGGK